MFKHITSLDALSPAEFHGLLKIAAYLKERRRAGVVEHSLAGRTLAMLFEKPSLRTRISFEVAMTELGGRAMYIRGEEVGIGTREAPQDVARVLGRMVQGVMARVMKHQTILDLARWSGVPVINGLCDLHHPCQVLGDFLTLQEHLGRTSGLRVVFIGDANNVSRSLAHACIHTGSTLVLACPRQYAFTAEDIAAFGPAWGRQVIQFHDPAQAVAGADALYSDVWTSMGQEAEKAERLRAFQGFQINDALIAKAGPQARIMHCLPAHRDEEITDSAMEHPRSIVFDQAENRLHAQKAVLRILLAADGAELWSLVTGDGGKP